MKIIGIGWIPIKLGNSLPIQGRLWISRLGCIGIALLGPAAFLLQLRPFVPSLAAEDTRRIVEKRLADIDLPLLKGVASSPTGISPPGYLESPAPAPWRNPLLDSIGSESLRLGLAEFDKSHFREAANHLRKATSDGSRETWLPFYHLGITELRLKEYMSAMQSLTEALRLLNLSKREIEPLEWAAARIAILRALGIVTHRSGNEAKNEAEALRYFKLAVGGLRDYEGNIVYSRKHLFKFDFLDIDSFDIWNTLVWGYIHSPIGTEIYDTEYPLATPFDQDDCLDNASVNEENPFHWEIEQCIANNEPLHLCRAYLNLGCVYSANRDFYEGENNEFRATLARLAYNVAWLITSYGFDSLQDEAPTPVERVSRFLELASEFSDGNSECEQRVLDLSRYLAFQNPKHRSLVSDAVVEKDGAPFESQDLENIGRESAELLLWRLYIRWQGLLRQEKPGQMITEVDEQLPFAGDFYAFLSAWKREVKKEFRDALAKEIMKELEQGRSSRALGIQRWRAPYLGSSWPWKARITWLGVVFSRSALFWMVLTVVWVVFLGISWLLHRGVVVPYLIYTTDYYLNEYRKRKLPTAEVIQREEARKRAAIRGHSTETKNPSGTTSKADGE